MCEKRRPASRLGKRRSTRRWPKHEATKPAGRILRNGLRLLPAPLQVLEPQQHREHALELAVEMHLVPSKAFQFVGIDSLSEGLLSNKRSDGEFLSAPVKPRQHFSLDEAPEAVRIRSGRHLILLQFAWVAGQLVRPPRLGVL